MTDKTDNSLASTVREYVESTLVTIILALFGISFVVQGFEIPSASMENTLQVGDRLLANKFVFAGNPGDGWGLLPYREVQRGDIMIFKYPFPPHIHYVKRVIGLPGDRIKIIRRQVHVNGERLDESYKVHLRPLPTEDFRDNFPPENGRFFYGATAEWQEQVAQLTQGGELVVPQGKYFVMGDNRDNSEDSRYWGFADRRNIMARPLLIYWSYHWFR